MADTKNSAEIQDKDIDSLEITEIWKKIKNEAYNAAKAKEQFEAIENTV